MLRLLNTHYIVSNLKLDNDRIEPVFSNRAETLYRFKKPLGRAYCASHQLVNKRSRRIPGQLAAVAGKYDRPVILSRRLLDEEVLSDTCKVNALEAYTSKLTFSVDTQRPTLVFIPVNHHPYWRARVNGKDTDIHRANYTFMTIAVPAGKSQVTLEFLNTKLVWGAVLFIILGLAAIMIAAVAVRSRWQKAFIVLAALVVIGRSLFSIPGIMNTEIPERSVVEQSGAK